MDLSANYAVVTAVVQELPVNLVWNWLGECFTLAGTKLAHFFALWFGKNQPGTAGV
jgi:hypothetical protein